MVYSNKNDIINLKDNALLTYRQARNHKDNLSDKWEEAEALLALLVLAVTRAETEETIEPTEREELDELLKEVNDLREIVMDEIKGQFASL